MVVCNFKIFTKMHQNMLANKSGSFRINKIRFVDVRLRYIWLRRCIYSLLVLSMDMYQRFPSNLANLNRYTYTLSIVADLKTTLSNNISIKEINKGFLSRSLFHYDTYMDTLITSPVETAVWLQADIFNKQLHARPTLINQLAKTIVMG